MSKVSSQMFAKKNIGATSSNEKGLTQKFCILLNRRKIKEPFFFQPEDMEDQEKGNSPQVDVGIFSDKEKIIVLDTIYGENDAFFKMEAKRLGKLGVAREKEYVIGRIENGKYLDTGGIERFKKGIHGRKLKHAAIIGYVQNENFDYWFLEINSWIEELIKSKSTFWKKEDKLIKTHSKNIESSLVLKPISYRTKPDSIPDFIQLTNFWVDLKD